MNPCDLCDDTGPLNLYSACHPTAPLRIQLLGDGTLVASCFLPDCGREVVRFKAEEFVAGEWKCGKCGFRLGKRILSAADGSTAVNNSQELPLCPNDSEQMAPISWREAVNEASQIAETWMKRARQLEAEWPSDFAMPVGDEFEVPVQ